MLPVQYRNRMFVTVGRRLISGQVHPIVLRLRVRFDPTIGNNDSIAIF